MESCCNGSNLIHSFLGKWLIKVMRFTSAEFPEAREFYGAMHLAEDILETAVDLEARFEAGELLIAERHRDRVGLMDVVVLWYMKV